jgi:hypothetical protein
VTVEWRPASSQRENVLSKTVRSDDDFIDFLELRRYHFSCRLKLFHAKAKNEYISLLESIYWPNIVF